LPILVLSFFILPTIISMDSLHRFVRDAVTAHANVSTDDDDYDTTLSVVGRKRERSPESSSSSATTATEKLSRPSNAKRAKIGEEMSSDQCKVFSAVMKKQNVFYSGRPGTGKSWLLRKLVFNRRTPTTGVYVTSMTGIAACDLDCGATTFHSFMGIRPLGYTNSNDDDGQNGNQLSMSNKDAVVELMMKRMNGIVKRRIRCTRLLFIDEISMASGELFDVAEELARIIRRDARPFGGIQVVACGDFHQLPPVFDAGERLMAFQAKSWSRVFSSENHYLLDTIFRQTEGDPILHVLEDIRNGRLGDKSRAILRKRVLSPHFDGEPDDDGMMPVYLHTHRRGVDEINKRRMMELPGEVQQYEATIYLTHERYRKQMLNSCRAPMHLELKIGAQIIYLKNEADEELYNGMRGVVVGFEEKSKLPIVKFEETPNCSRVLTYKQWKLETPEGNELAYVQQIPVDVAFALTIHKSQGMTIKSVMLNSSKAFAEGQILVGMSRVRSINGLHLVGSLPRDEALHVRPDVVEFYRESFS
jgi:ATP-dependent DNA helicase PIF1